MSMRKEVVLRKDWGIWKKGHNLVACGSMLPVYFVGVPLDAKVLYAVFTDAKPTNSNYTITRPSLMHGQRVSRLADIRQAMYFGGQIALGEMHDKGYRYMSIEYNA